LFVVVHFLARDAQTHARHGLAARLGDGIVALLASREAGTLRQLAAHPLNAVFDRRVDLVLHGAIPCPAGCHVASTGTLNEVEILSMAR